MQWILLFEGAHSAEGEEGFNNWLLDSGYRLAVSDSVDVDVTRGNLDDTLRQLRVIAHDAAAFVTLLSVLSGDAPPPRSIVDRSKLVSQAKSLAAEVERLQCIYDFNLLFLNPRTGEKQNVSSAEVEELIHSLCEP